MNQMFAGLKDADLLILDDLGAHQPTEWASEKLYQLCASRYLRRAPTLITTNVPAGESRSAPGVAIAGQPTRRGSSHQGEGLSHGPAGGGDQSGATSTSRGGGERAFDPFLAVGPDLFLPDRDDGLEAVDAVVTGLDPLGAMSGRRPPRRPMLRRSRADRCGGAWRCRARPSVLGFRWRSGASPSSP